VARRVETVPPDTKKRESKELSVKRRSLGLLALLALLAGGLSACSSTSGGGSEEGGTINGAGSTFAAPIYQQWGTATKDRGVSVNYQPVGSGAGVAQVQAGTADFGASDPPLTDKDRAGAKKGKLVQIPTAFGAITVAYNGPGLRAGLKLDGATLTDIFLGKVRNWNDPAISRLNPGMRLPSQPITVVHRSDESGTTKGFTTFLSAYSPIWKSQVGANKTVKWPTGTGAKGNDGVAAAIKQQVGSIGYVEQAYALQNRFPTAAVKNKSGRFVGPTLATTTAAGDGVKVPKDLGINVIDSSNPSAYPIASQTFVVTYDDMCKAGLSPSAAGRVKAFLDYGLADGQAVLGQLAYAKLPSNVLNKARDATAKLRCNGAPVRG
jgi:phosphate transport system substrate-binding protein